MRSSVQPPGTRLSRRGLPVRFSKAARRTRLVEKTNRSQIYDYIVAILHINRLSLKIWISWLVVCLVPEGGAE